MITTPCLEQVVRVLNDQFVSSDHVEDDPFVTSDLMPDLGLQRRPVCEKALGPVS